MDGPAGSEMLLYQFRHSANDACGDYQHDFDAGYVNEKTGRGRD